MYVEWRRVQRAGMRRLQESYVPLFARTRRFRAYCSNVVPGMLQTYEYAAALLSAISEFHGTPNDVPEAARARVERSSVLYEGGHTFALVMEEAALRHLVGDARTMKSQLAFLLEATRLPSVSLGVIPSGSLRRMWMIETFSIYDESLASVELLTAAVNITAPTELAQYLKAFQELQSLAVYGAAARALINSALQELR